jgi:hypothetical protein
VLKTNCYFFVTTIESYQQAVKFAGKWVNTDPNSAIGQDLDLNLAITLKYFA